MCAPQSFKASAAGIACSAQARTPSHPPRARVATIAANCDSNAQAQAATGKADSPRRAAAIIATPPTAVTTSAATLNLRVPGKAQLSTVTAAMARLGPASSVPSSVGVIMTTSALRHATAICGARSSQAKLGCAAIRSTAPHPAASACRWDTCPPCPRSPRWAAAVHRATHCSRAETSYSVPLVGNVSPVSRTASATTTANSCNDCASSLSRGEVVKTFACKNRAT
mmetsp:Transcript_36098/g.86909  ORF Transcript_36098/g.86909 Transcript_36098/m.86909 type:complete len:226 (-) Transcript_36098:162-839(-)